MKHFAAIAIMLLCTFIATTGHSQTASKPKQFSNFPDVIDCSEAALSSIFHSTQGQNISLSFSDNFSFSGNVVNNVVKYDNLQSAVIKSAAYHNSIFSISRITNKDNTVSYVGRIVNKNYFDGYELKRDAAGNYRLVKMETDRAIPDCSPN
ncbi:MAG TPA: hypothetical protein PK133_10010 [Ferruginibacter sp.]|nr:hypothetical protein [Chitinophagaceae bacterium]MBP6287673.1 hypothetical protein [Ferruginibacter sp.]HQY12538.1 hypothetical protein [Ferruginibacter sp.]